MFAFNTVTFLSIKGTALSLAIVNAIVIAGLLLCVLLLLRKMGKAKDAPQKNKRETEVSSERQTDDRSNSRAENN